VPSGRSLLETEAQAFAQIGAGLHGQMRQELDTRKAGLGALEARLRCWGPESKSLPALLHHDGCGDGKSWGG